MFDFDLVPDVVLIEPNGFVRTVLPKFECLFYGILDRANSPIGFLNELGVAIEFFRLFIWVSFPGLKNVDKPVTFNVCRT